MKANPMAEQLEKERQAIIEREAALRASQQQLRKESLKTKI